MSFLTHKELMNIVKPIRYNKNRLDNLLKRSKKFSYTSKENIINEEDQKKKAALLHQKNLYSLEEQISKSLNDFDNSIKDEDKKKFEDLINSY